MTTYRIAGDVAWVSQEDLDGDEPTAYLVRVPDGRPIVLPGSGCLVWLALADGGTADEVTASAAEMAGVAAADVSADVATLIDHLVGLGVVEAD